jgi:hypothetical protein
MREILWQNNLNFVKDIPQSNIRVEFIIIVIIVSEEKTGGVTFVPPLLL